jgi:hypothetical protein
MWVAVISTDTLFLYEDGVQKYVHLLSTPYARNIYFSDDEESLVIEVPKGKEIFNMHIVEEKEDK